jgi:hypothetical protein
MTQNRGSSFLVLKVTCKVCREKAAVKGIATGFNRQSKLPSCSDVVISYWNGRNLSEQVPFDCSIVCAVYIQHL